MSNLFNGFFVSVDEDAKVVDTNDRVEQYIREENEKRERERAEEARRYEDTEEEYADEGFSEGLTAESLDALTDEDAESAVIKSGKASELAAEKEALAAEIQSLREEIESAKGEAEQILENARNEAEALKAQAYEEAKRQGYTDGNAEGMAAVEKIREETQAMQESLVKEYEEKFAALEPEFIDTISGIYEHIFKVDLSSYRNMVMQLLEDTFDSVEDNRNIIIHVNKEDFADVAARKDELIEQAGLLADHVEFISDVTLGPGGCMIETDGGIYDCSLETELAELRRKLKLLAYHGE